MIKCAYNINSMSFNVTLHKCVKKKNNFVVCG